MGTPERKRRRKVWGIRRSTLDLILEVSRESYPKEFAGVLRAEKGIITEIMLLPGTLSGEQSAILYLHMLPIDFSVVGSVHSHPSRSFYPSGPDLGFFASTGHTHIITARPYDYKSWRAYDRAGNTIELEIVD